MDEGEHILARLESELSVDAASIEYYITMPFDERLELLLEGEKPSVEINANTSSTHFENKQLFPPNAKDSIDVFLDENIASELAFDALEFNIAGSMKLTDRQVMIDAKITPETGDSTPTFIQNIPGVDEKYIILRPTNKDYYSEVVDAKGLLYLLGSIADTESSYITRALKEIEVDGKVRKKDLQILLINTWSLIGYKLGSKKESKNIFQELPQSNDMYKESIKALNIEEEKEHETLTTFTLEHTKCFEDLDLEDTHSLTLEFSSDPKKVQNTIISQAAKRIIASGITPMTLVSITGSRKQDGKDKPLDLNDPEIVTLFVDWFDQLVSG